MLKLTFLTTIKTHDSRWFALGYQMRQMIIRHIKFDGAGNEVTFSFTVVSVSHLQSYWRCTLTTWFSPAYSFSSVYYDDWWLSVSLWKAPNIHGKAVHVVHTRAVILPTQNLSASVECVTASNALECLQRVGWAQRQPTEIDWWPPQMF